MALVRNSAIRFTTQIFSDTIAYYDDFKLSDARDHLKGERELWRKLIYAFRRSIKDAKPTYHYIYPSPLELKEMDR